MRALASLRTAPPVWASDEAETFKRTQAARLAREYPVIFTMVADGKLHLSAINLVAPHLTEENHLELLTAACGKSKRALEELLAARWPRPDAPTILRKEPAVRPPSTPAPLPSLFAPPPPSSPESTQCPCATEPQQTSLATDGSTASVAGGLKSAGPASGAFALAMPAAAKSGKRPVLEPLSEQRYKLQVTLSRKANDTLLRLQALMRHSIPNGDLSIIIEKALADLCDKVEARRLGKKRGRRQTTNASAKDAGRGEAVSELAGASAGAEANADVSAPRAANGDGTPAAAPGQPRPVTKKRSRYISNADRRQVIAREGLQCSFVDADGNRCQERGFIEFHHQTAFCPWWRFHR